MARKIYTDKPAILTLKIESEFMREIDGEVLRQSNRAGRVVTRTDVVKELLHEALDARSGRKKK